ncbi:MAG: hypothetical protein AB2693_20460, partial [Candidatus Thiodiazotropha sp.]
QKHSFFCLTDTHTGELITDSGVASTSGSLTVSLHQEVLHYRANSFSASTSKTYSVQRSAFLKFCTNMGIKPVPLSQEDLGRYVAYLSRRLCFSSVRQYLNIVRLMHLEAGLHNPLDKNWYVASILKGVKRVKGDASVQKLPITPDILRQVFVALDLHCAFDRTFWAACLVGFFSFFRKSSLLVPSHLLFDPRRNLCANDVQFSLDGAVLAVRWSKVIQFQERTLHIPLPKIPTSPLCPSTALLRLTLENPKCTSPTPLFCYTWMGASNVPLTQKQFTDKLQVCLTHIGLDSSKYSGHSLRRGGASYALKCGLPIDLIKIQGDWRSNACERYLEHAFEQRQLVARQMGASVAASFSS